MTRNKILIVDDVEINREMLNEILCDEYEILQADNGKNAIKLLEEHSADIAVVLLDLIMPEVDGFGVLEEMNRRKWQQDIPVLVISSDGHVATEERCFNYGVTDFIKKPYYESIVRKRIKNTIELYRYKNHLEEKVEQQTIKLREKNLILQRQTEKLENINNDIITILATIVESRNLESGNHIKRVVGFSKILAFKIMTDYPEYGLTPNSVEMISSASMLHDIGKIAIPDHILLKPGRLTPEEFEEMKLHSVKGCEILEQIEGIWDEEYNKLAYDICRHHHERYDGRGYPDGLKGDDISIAAQIVSLADVYDALVSDRVYKKAFPKDKAFEMIVNGECGTFSPKLIDCFKKTRPELEDMAEKNKEVF